MKPEALIYRLWAKTNERDEGYTPEGWTLHPLPFHLFDVGLVAEAWLHADEKLFERFCTLWPEADPEAIHRALVLTAAAHDTGKLDPAFQSKSDRGWAHGYGTFWNGVRPNGSGFDHGAGTARIFGALFGGRYGVPQGVEASWETLVPLIHVGAGHHGTLYADLDPDPMARAHPQFAPLVATLLGEIAHHFGPPLPLPEGDVPGAFLLLVAGFVSVADWFGSDTRYFPPLPDVTTREEAAAYLTRHRRGATGTQALRDAGLLADLRVQVDFSALFGPKGAGWQPQPGFQQAACAVAFGEREGAEIAVVEAPMGLGKTEIALFLAAKALHSGAASGLYFALPTQATSNALFHRVEQYADRVRGDADLALALAHGAKRYFADYRALLDGTHRLPFARAQRGDPSEPNPPSEVVAPSWVQPSKRALLAPIGLGTIDQALLGAMGVKHGFVRLFGLARKVVVFDEIHAYDAYMGVLLEHLLKWLGALGTKVILLSATLPDSLRRRLLGAYGAGGAASDAYPQLLHLTAGRASEIVLDPTPPANRKTWEVNVTPVEAAGDGEARTAAGVAWVKKAYAKGGCIAWIRNTVREAQQAFEALVAAGIETELLHARFTRIDRGEKEEKLLGRYGKPAPRNEQRPARHVVVATQVIEQSVDVDFDAMLSDLAPIDLLLQRAGRLWRHERAGERHGHACAVLGVLMPDAEGRARLDFGSSIYVYDADTLARSAFLVHADSTWTLPDACRSLVADLYDRGENFWTAEKLGADADRLGRARDLHAARLTRMKSVAQKTLLTPPTQMPVMRAPRNDRSDAGEHVALVTRYGAHSAAAVLFRATARGPVPVGQKDPVSVPPGDDYRARLVAEEALALASVSFPWHGERPETAMPPDVLAPLYTWWRDTHPYDDRLFLLLDDDGSFRTATVEGCYDPDTGLTLARTSITPTAPEPVPFEDL